LRVAHPGGWKSAIHDLFVNRPRGGAACRSESHHDDDEQLMKEAMDVLSTKILSRKQSVPSGDCHYRAGSHIYRLFRR